MRPLSFEQILARVREQFGRVDVGFVQGRLAIQFNLTGEGGGTFYAEVKNGVLSIEPYEYYERDVMLTLSSGDFVKMLERKLDPVVAFSTGRLKVDGDLGKALELQRFL